MSRWLASLLVVLVACGGAKPTEAPRPAPVAEAHPTPSADDAVLPLWPQVTHGTLPNGLTYYILKQNAFWSGWLANSYRYGDDPALILDPRGLLARMTSDNVKAAAKHYLDGKQYYQAVLLPAAK